MAPGKVSEYSKLTAEHLKMWKGKAIQIWGDHTPTVSGKLIGVDTRYGVIMIETDQDVVEKRLSSVRQIRYKKDPDADEEKKDE